MGHVVDVVGFRVGREVMLGLKSRFVHVSGDFITLFSIFVVAVIFNGLMLWEVCLDIFKLGFEFKVTGFMGKNFILNEFLFRTTPFGVSLYVYQVFENVVVSLS